jgi:3'(2'), 5'-bisphosphate nucleotidase
MGYRGQDMTPSIESDLASGRLVEVLAQIAEEAAQVILPYWRTGAVVETKSDNSPVTLADRAAEALILKRLKAEWADVDFVAEEDSAVNGIPPQVGEWFWLIDPLDGTKGFIQGRECFTVNIALVRGEAVVAGVVNAPATGVTWATTVPGQGAQRRAVGEVWHSIEVRDRKEGRVALLSHSVTDDEAARLATRYNCTEWQAMDSSIKFCLIAEGRYDAYPRTGPTCEWDTAAGQAVLEAAGGRVMGMDGQALTYRKPGFRNGVFTAIAA